MRRAVVVAAAMLFPGFAALAQAPGIQGVVDALKAQGYSGIEVSKPQGGKITVEAYRQGAQRELVYDARTGRVLADESHPSSRAGDGSGPAGTSAAGDDRGTDGAGHDAGDDRGGKSGGRDSSADDHGGSSSDDHGGSSGGGSSDDHGGSSGGGSDDSGDDHGGDR